MNQPSHDSSFCKRCKRNLPITNFRLIDIPQMKQVPIDTCKECEEFALNKYKRIEREGKMKIRIKIIQMLGCKCKCCGITEWWNLTADHIIPIRTKKRDSLYKFYKKLLQNPEYIKEFQCLCFGCNGSKNDGEKCQINHKLHLKV